MEFFPLFNQTQPCSFLAGRQVSLSKDAGKFCFNKHTHSFFKSHRGKCLCRRPTHTLPVQEVKALSGATESASRCCAPEYITSIMWLPQTECTSRRKCKRWQGCVSGAGPGKDQGLGWSHEAFFLWALVSWPVDPSPMIVQRFCQIKQGGSFSRMPGD